MKNIPDISWIGCMHEGIPVATENLDACIKFYLEVLGLKLLERPKTLDQFGPGAWLGDEDNIKLAPSSQNAQANASPIPEEAPVIQTTLSLNRIYYPPL